MGYLGLPPLTSPPAGSVVQIQVMHVSFMNMFYGAFYNNKPLGMYVTRVYQKIISLI